MDDKITYEDFVSNIINKPGGNIIIYGKNNSGKTYVQKDIFERMCEEDVKNSLDEQKVHFAHYFDVNRLGKNEIEYANDTIDFKVAPEFFDKIKKRFDNNSQLYSYKIARQWVEKFGKERIVNNALISVFSMNQTISLNNYNTYSDGIKNVINVVSLLLMIESCVLESKNKIIAKPVVLIDEIELYLHVSAQVAFVEYLLKEFKNIRFIFSSHSPLLMQRIKNCKMYRIYDNHKYLEILDSQYFRNIDDIIDLCFDLNKAPEQLLEFDKYLKECLKDPNVFKLEKYRRMLENCRFKDYNFNLLINSMILEFIDNAKKGVNLKKGSDLYNAIYS